MSRYDNLASEEAAVQETRKLPLWIQIITGSHFATKPPNVKLQSVPFFFACTLVFVIIGALGHSPAAIFTGVFAIFGVAPFRDLLVIDQMVRGTINISDGRLIPTGWAVFFKGLFAAAYFGIFAVMLQYRFDPKEAVNPIIMVLAFAMPWVTLGIMIWSFGIAARLKRIQVS